MSHPQLSLKALEIFRQVARTGSLQSAARLTGLTVSTVSHHIKVLESTLDVPLLDHGRRPVRTTPKGAEFLQNIDEVMRLLHMAQAQVQSADLADTTSLSLAMVEDFDSEIAPELARTLSQSMPRCAFQHLTRASHRIVAMVRNERIDIGVAAKPQFDRPGLIERPLLRDPYVLAVPRAAGFTAEDYLNSQTTLPLFRYSREMIMGEQIDGQMKRLKLGLQNLYEFESNETIMSMIADGLGWAITTPTNYVRSTRFQRQVQLLPFPSKGFARTLSVFTSQTNPSPLLDPVVGTLRQLIQTRAIDPLVSRHEWLHDGFRLLEDAPPGD